MLLTKIIVTGLVVSGLFSPVNQELTDKALAPSKRILKAADLPKAKSTGEWLSQAVRFLKDGDRLNGSMIREIFDPAELTEGEAEITDLIDAVEYFVVKKSNKDKIRLVLHLKNDENIKRKFTVDGEVTKVTLKDRHSALLIKRLGSGKVECGIRGIGAFYGGKPVPERLMSFTINKDELELMEVAGFDVDSGYDLELPANLLADD